MVIKNTIKTADPIKLTPYISFLYNMVDRIGSTGDALGGGAVRWYLSTVGTDGYLPKALAWGSQTIGAIFGSFISFTTLVGLTQGLFVLVVLFVVVKGGGMKLSEAWRYLRKRQQLKTRPVRDPDTGTLYIGDGDFPFPIMLHDAVRSSTDLTETFVDGVMQASRFSRKKTKDLAKSDALMFKIMFVPISQRKEEFTNEQKKEAVASLKQLGYKDTLVRNVILRRVSQYDVKYRPDIIEAAAKTPGVARSKEWAKKYAKLRRLNMAKK